MTRPRVTFQGESGAQLASWNRMHHSQAHAQGNLLGTDEHGETEATLETYFDGVYYYLRDTSRNSGDASKRTIRTYDVDQCGSGSSLCGAEARTTDNVWPKEIEGMEAAVTGLYRQFESCAATLLEALADYYGLSKSIFSDMITDGNSILRTIHYPPIDGGMPAGAVRAAAHEDINLITLLIESQGAGLEILTQENEWEAVHALEGDIIVDSGDMLHRLTNGVIPATTHRVVNPVEGENRSRYSMPFFVHPFSACDLTVMDHFVTEERPAKWPPITAGQFLQQRLEEIGLIKK